MEQTLCVYNRSLRNAKKRKELNSNLKSINMIDPVTEWFKITQYDDKRSISISKLVGNTWLSRYPWPA